MIFFSSVFFCNFKNLQNLQIFKMCRNFFEFHFYLKIIFIQNSEFRRNLSIQNFPVDRWLKSRQTRTPTNTNEFGSNISRFIDAIYKEGTFIILYLYYELIVYKKRATKIKKLFFKMM